MQSVYIETTIPSYLAARPAADHSRTAADQEITHSWWKSERVRYRLYTSLFTIDEASNGDPSAAQRRLAWLEEIPQLPITTNTEPLATSLVKLLRLPPKAVLDAFHLSLCILHQIDYLLTWNCTHLANPVLQKELVEYCRYHDLYIPIICTPEDLSPS